MGQATAGRVVVLPVVSQGALTDESHMADLIEAELAARGVLLVAMHDARDRLHARSRKPLLPDQKNPETIARDARAAVEHVAFGRSAAARQSVDEVLARAERALESLNRETRTARHVLDACLALVRSELHEGRHQEALEQAMRCRRIVPDLAPSEFMHPARVVGVLAEADSQLRRMRIGQLTVESVVGTGCAVYVNGRHLGVTPFRLDRSAEGEYRVQVECSSSAERVHVVHLGEEPVHLVVDAALDHALESDGRIALVYLDAANAARHRMQHAAEVARLVRAEEAVLVSKVGGSLQLARVRADQASLLGSTVAPLPREDGGTEVGLAAAVDALLQGRIQPERSAAVVDVWRPIQSPSDFIAPTSKHARRKRVLGIAAAGVTAAGLGLLSAGAAFERQRKNTEERIVVKDPNDSEMIADAERADENYHRAARLRWLGVGGGALLVTAVPLVRIDLSHGVPWWSYALGGAGIALTTWAAIAIARDGQCAIEPTEQGCLRIRESAGKGALLLSGAAPLLTFPIDHLLEWKIGSHRMRARAQLALSDAHQVSVYAGWVIAN